MFLLLNVTATILTYTSAPTLALHDALPIWFALISLVIFELVASYLVNTAPNHNPARPPIVAASEDDSDDSDDGSDNSNSNSNSKHPPKKASRSKRKSD